MTDTTHTQQVQEDALYKPQPPRRNPEPRAPRAAARAAPTRRATRRAPPSRRAPAAASPRRGRTRRRVVGPASGRPGHGAVHAAAWPAARRAALSPPTAARHASTPYLTRTRAGAGSAPAPAPSPAGAGAEAAPACGTAPQAQARVRAVGRATRPWSRRLRRRSPGVRHDLGRTPQQRGPLLFLHHSPERQQRQPVRRARYLLI